MRIAMLGPLLVSGAEIGGARVRSLIVRLALDPGRVVGADRLAADLWPDDPPAHPQAALQSLVSRARREAPGLIASHPSGYLLDLPPDEVDVWVFERLVRTGRARAALGLWRGRPLADAENLPFAAPPAARLDELRLQALATRITADLTETTHLTEATHLTGVAGPVEGAADVLAELEGLVAAHPLREPFHALLVRALAGQGRRAEALAAYERVRTLLDETLGADPGPELKEAHLAALRDTEPNEQPSLPTPLTSFVGRTEDLARLRALLAGGHRLVTLTGPGGVGKTRLALETASGFRRVRLVELAAPSSGTRAALEGASGARAARGGAPDVRAAPGRASDVRAALGRALNTADPVNALRGTGSVLVLDNCEHVVEEAARVAEWLLTEVPDLRILATSREPLDISGESTHPVAPLDDEAAVALFAERAAAARPGAIGPGDRADVARICAELDGIPLAIELAAARLRTMPISVLVGQLGDRLSFRGGRTAQPRHRTLRAVIDWSWELLDEAERELLRGLSVFAGGATLEAARQVCGADVATLSSLVDKSLVGLSGERYTMLETIRRYAGESGEPPLDAHARYYTELAERCEPYLRTGEQVSRLAVLDAEQANLDAALEHTREPLRLFLARVWPWVMRGRRREACERAAEVLRRSTPADGELAYGLAAVIAGEPPSAAVLAADHPAALAAWALADRLGPPSGVVELAETAVARLSCHPDPWTRAAARLMAGIVRFEYGRSGQAEELLLPALDGFRAVGDRWGLAFALYWLSLAAENRGDYAAALEFAERSERPAAEIGGLEALPGPLMFLVRLAQLRARSGDLDGAAAVAGRAWEAAHKTGDPLGIVRVLHANGELARLSGDPARARALLREALALAATTPVPPQLEALVNVELARVADEPGPPLRRALELMEGGDDRTVRATVLEAAARALSGSAEPAVVARIAGAAGALRDVPAVTRRLLAELGLSACQDEVAMSNPERYALSSLSSP
ncbi:BTAD domain-containing putative transcriptional regulator [Nonomuraea sp. NPDC050547]|uniref:BTAD domain-containing putative transcriptional regulator n=1 Tax=Nonomuraea sp. NPDC050547 TaxID=3364368 RepID=UPI00379EAAD5